MTVTTMGKAVLSVQVRDCDFGFWPAGLKVLGKMPVSGETGMWTRVMWTGLLDCVMWTRESRGKVEGKSQERANEGGMVSNRCKGENVVAKRSSPSNFDFRKKISVYKKVGG